MKRRALRLAGLALAGLVMTYAVGWSIAAWAGWHGKWSAPNGTLWQKQAWLWATPTHWPEANQRWDARAFGGTYVEVAHAGTLKPEYSLAVTQFLQRRRRVGWPLHALESTQSLELTPGVTAPQEWRPVFFTEHVWIHTFAEGVHVTGHPARGQINLPLVPRWPHVVASVVLYGAAAWVVFLIPAHLRRVRRRRRGRCEHCGYELRGLATCPECGIERRA